MSVSNPTFYHVAFDLTPEQYAAALKLANAGHFGTVQDYFKSLCQGAPEIKAAATVFHSVPGDQKTGKEGKK